MPPTKLRCVWLSRHAPTPAQRESLSGYYIIQIDQSFRDAKEAWREACRAGKPDLIMAVLPTHMMAQFIRLARPIPVIRARMDWRGDWGRDPVWTGKWEIAEDVAVHYGQFSPDEFYQRQVNGGLRALS